MVVQNKYTGSSFDDLLQAIGRIHPMVSYATHDFGNSGAVQSVV